MHKNGTPSYIYHDKRSGKFFACIAAKDGKRLLGRQREDVETALADLDDLRRKALTLHGGVSSYFVNAGTHTPYVYFNKFTNSYWTMVKVDGKRKYRTNFRSVQEALEAREKFLETGSWPERTGQTPPARRGRPLGAKNKPKKVLQLPQSDG